MSAVALHLHPALLVSNIDLDDAVAHAKNHYGSATRRGWSCTRICGLLQAEASHAPPAHTIVSPLIATSQVIK